MGAAERIARLCRLAGDEELDALATEAGATRLLDRIREGAKAGADSLSEHDLDALDEAFARIGIDGLTVADRVYRPLPATESHPLVYAWVCPTRACSRAEADGAPSHVAPVCALTNCPLERLRLAI